MVDSEGNTLEKNLKRQEPPLEINALSDTFNQNATVTDNSSETLQIQAVDPKHKSKPQFKNFCSLCHKNYHTVSTCYRRLNMLMDL